MVNTNIDDEVYACISDFFFLLLTFRFLGEWTLVIQIQLKKLVFKRSLTT